MGHRIVCATMTALGFVVAQAAAATPVTLGDLFQDHMVLPRHHAAVFGQAGANETVTVAFGALTQTTTAGADGAFRLTLPDLDPGLKGTLSVSTPSGRRDIADVITGDVFLCSGQSNMQLSVTRTLNEDNVIANSTSDTLRNATVFDHSSLAPLVHLATPVTWEKAGPETTGAWSATCYYFAQALQDRLHVPIGTVHASWGGSNITVWLSEDGIRPFTQYAGQVRLLKSAVADPDGAGVMLGHGFEAWWQKAGGQGRPWAATPSELAAWPRVPDMTLNWERWGVPELAAYDGNAWYATHVVLTAAQAAEGAVLGLGKVDDIDTTWVNGQAIGSTAGNMAPHSYRLPRGALEAGDNTIIVNVIDLWTNGGIYGDQPPRLALAGGETVALKDWVYRTVPDALRYPPRAPWDATGGVTVLYNGMIAPLGPFAFTAALWYQGETNVGDSAYRSELAAMMADWRRQFGPDLPFAIVQLANNGLRPTRPAESGWANLREAERLAVIADGKATLATAVDIGEPSDVHPANKIELGRRLARAVAVKVYGQTGLSESGPQIAAIHRAGSDVTLDFSGLEGDFVALDAKRPIGFELCGADGVCAYADADIAGRSVVLHDPVATAVKVRFCWADAPVCTLYDGADGLPAIPFEQAVP